MRELGVSDCEMQEGSLRCDANVNVHLPQAEGGVIATPLVEIKNLNSFRFLERAVRYEAQRQFEQWQKDPGYVIDKVSKATAGWDEQRGRTVFQRRKEEAADYRYFPDPDLAPVIVDEVWLERIRAEMGELPSSMHARLVRQYGLSEYDSGVLVGQGRALVSYFEEAARVSGDAKAACNQVTNQVRTTLKETGGRIEDFPIPAARLGELILKQKEMGLNKQTAGAIYEHMLTRGGSADEAIKDLGISAAVADTAAVVEMVRRAMAANPKAVADFKKGKSAAANSIKGAIMRESKGSLRADAVEQVLRQELEKA
jgi:aspartyl-tRNA(Asn)/glutamyl-tRNA(Gln) amidotransferase subunit B